jgi:hypothetical protein
MPLTINLQADQIHRLDLTPATTVLAQLDPSQAIAQAGQTLQFAIDYPRSADDPRELSEIPEVRLWFLRLDAEYPWLLLWLDWGVELSRYTAMLVPHQFSRSEGIQYNPEALELFVMGKAFTLLHWLQGQGLEGRSKIKAMLLTLGYELDDAFFDLIAG